MDNPEQIKVFVQAAEVHSVTLADRASRVQSFVDFLAARLFPQRDEGVA